MHACLPGLARSSFADARTVPQSSTPATSATTAPSSTWCRAYPRDRLLENQRFSTTPAKPNIAKPDSPALLANNGRSAPKYPKTLKHVHLICGEASNVSTLEIFLKSCEHLESLHLQDKGFPPSFLACVSELHSLTQLTVSHVQAVRISPKLGVQCPSLTRLTLDHMDLDRVRNLRSSMAAFPHTLELLSVTNMRARFREDVCEFLRVLLACVASVRSSNRLSQLSLSFDSSVAAVCRRIGLDLREWFERCKLVQVSFERCILGPGLLQCLATYAAQGGVDKHLDDSGSLRPNLLSSVRISNCVIEDGGHMDARLSRIISIQ
ncbi:hypothetical protein HDU77_007027 [Chytriomyces hyalinus]|nr:hypothetical protein HDU77_007027 [Chytriomyces hyalinus]